MTLQPSMFHQPVTDEELFEGILNGIQQHTGLINYCVLHGLIEHLLKFDWVLCNGKARHPWKRRLLDNLSCSCGTESPKASSLEISLGFLDCFSLLLGQILHGDPASFGVARSVIILDFDYVEIVVGSHQACQKHVDTKKSTIGLSCQSHTRSPGRSASLQCRLMNQLRGGARRTSQFDLQLTRSSKQLNSKTYWLGFQIVPQDIGQKSDRI